MNMVFRKWIILGPFWGPLCNLVSGQKCGIQLSLTFTTSRNMLKSWGGWNTPIFILLHMSLMLCVWEIESQFQTIIFIIGQDTNSSLGLYSIRIRLNHYTRTPMPKWDTWAWGTSVFCSFYYPLQAFMSFGA